MLRPEDYLGLAVHVANKVHKRVPSMDLDVLCAEAMLALCLSCKKYKEGPTQPSTFLYRCVYNYLLTYCKKEIRHTKFVGVMSRVKCSTEDVLAELLDNDLL